MIVQKTFKNNLPTVYLVGTPIGNLNDVSERMIKTLTSVDVIFCEDTRTSKKLLSNFKINTKLSSLHKYNEIERVGEINKLLLNNKSIAIISDAGVPVISDPGAVVIKELFKINDHFNLTSINAGPAYIHAVVASGFISKTNYFYGFLEEKNLQAKKKELLELINKHSNSTIISFYESVHRMKETILVLNEILSPNHEIVIARELTKLNEEFIRGSIEEVNEFVTSDEFLQKGEFVIVLDVNRTNSNEVKTYSDDELIKIVSLYLQDGFKLKQASQIVADLSNKSKNDIYELYIKNTK